MDPIAQFRDDITKLHINDMNRAANINTIYRRLDELTVALERVTSNKANTRDTEPEQYKYRFDESVQTQELKDTLLLAMIAVESLHGRSRVRMAVRVNLDKASRTCVIDASTDVGSALARIFTGFAIKEYGEHLILISRSQSSGCGSNDEA